VLYMLPLRSAAHADLLHHGGLHSSEPSCPCCRIHWRFEVVLVLLLLQTSKEEGELRCCAAALLFAALVSTLLLQASGTPQQLDFYASRI